MSTYMTFCRRALLAAASCSLTFALRAQKVADVEEGYYTLSPLELHPQGYVYGYDTDASRAPYGNAADYDHPCGRNGEVAYLYCMPSTSVSLMRSAYYFKPLGNGAYSVQSLSGEAYSYLSMAAYDRRLLYHTPMPERPFYLRMPDCSGGTEWAADEYAVKPFHNAALCDSLVSQAHGVGAMIVLDRVDASRITPAMGLLRALSDARGAMAVYRVGGNPGEVSPAVAYGLAQAVDEAKALADDRTTTQEQADAMEASLRLSTTQYLQAAPMAQNPLTEGYYFVVNAYRAFLLRQGKEKALAAAPSQGTRSLAWGDLNVNDGSMAFRLTPSGEPLFRMDSYDQSLSMADMEIRYDAEGTWTLARSTDSGAPMTAANHSPGANGLYGKNASGSVEFAPEGHLYSGYTASWYLRRAYHQVAVPSSGWAVLGTSFPVEVPEGVEVYSVVRRAGNLCLRPYSFAVIPARTAVVLHAARGTYQFPSTVVDAPDIPDNVLLPVCEALTGASAGSMRTLRVKNGVAGFSRTSSTSAAAGTAYVPCMDGEEDFLPLSLEGDAVSGVRADDSGGGQACDLMGRKVYPTGQKAGDIYIINNKKILRR